MRWLLSACVLLGACHLAEAVDPPRCPASTHSDNGLCVADVADGPTVTIAGCVVTPSSINVAVNGEFRFKNDDDVEHTISGDDGKVWASAPAHANSPIFAITKAGSWGYRVSECPKGGTVVVE